MKKIIFILIGIIAVFTTACDPQYDDAPNIGDVPTIDFSINDADPNTIIFNAISDNGFMYNWDLGNGEKKEGKTIAAYYPFAGNYTVTCVASGKGGENIISKEITVTITDPAIAEKPGFKELTNSGLGRVWAYTVPDGFTDADTPGYCYMTADYDWEEFWWNPYNDDEGTESPDHNATMKFDLNGGYNYTFIDADGTEMPGTFLLDMENMTLTIVDAPYPDQYEENLNPDVAATGIYEVKILDDGTLYLWQNQLDWGYGWSWVFNSEDE
jgi:PKD repeat protein